MDADRRKVCLPSNAFDVEAVKRAAHRLSEDLVVEIAFDGDQIVCTLRTLKADADMQKLEDRFRREVLDYDLRMRIAKETEAVRNVVLSLAFSKTGLQE